MKLNRMLAMAVTVASLLASAAIAETVLKVRPFGDLKQIDPVITSDYMVRNHGYRIYDTLFAMDESLSIKPQMVEIWTVSGDGLTYDFTLRDGLVLHQDDAFDRWRWARQALGMPGILLGWSPAFWRKVRGQLRGALDRQRNGQ